MKNEWVNSAPVTSSLSKSAYWADSGLIGQHCFTHSHNRIIGKLISVSNWHVVHLFNLQVLGPSLGPKSGRIEIKLYKKKEPCNSWPSRPCSLLAAPGCLFAAPPSSGSYSTLGVTQQSPLIKTLAFRMNLSYPFPSCLLFSAAQGESASQVEMEPTFALVPTE